MPHSRVWLVGLVACTLWVPARATAHGTENIAEDARAWKRVDEIVVTASRRPLTAASSRELNMRDYLLRPHATTQEVMNNVPGLLVVQHQGGGKAFQYFMRGFDNDHGTDFLLVTDGMPVNLVSHAHGQGWADSNYLIPETIQGIRLFKGPYFAEFGDFAVSGALAFKTRDEFEENFVLVQGGSFDSARAVVGGSTEALGGKLLVASEAFYSDAWFEQPQDFWRVNALVKWTWEPTPAHRLTISGQAYTAQWDASGQIPARAVEAGEVGRFGSLDPTEGGRTNRQILNLQYSWEPDPTRRVHAQLWAQHYGLDLWSNFTFFRDTGLRFRIDSDGELIDDCQDWSPSGADCRRGTSAGPYLSGDGIFQRDERFLVGGRLVHGREGSLGGLPWTAQVGLRVRGDFPELTLDRQVRRRRFFSVNRVRVDEWQLGGFATLEVVPRPWVRIQLGLRGDVFDFRVRDRLPTQSPDPDFDSVSIAGSETDAIVSPKINVVVAPFGEPHSELYLNFGTGFHSNDARAVVRAGTSGLVRATGGEVGLRTTWFPRLELASATWFLNLDQELVFSGDGGDVDASVDLSTGNFVPSGASRRWGVDLHARYQATDWLHLDYDLAWASARLQDGGQIPLAPTLYMNGGLTIEHRGFSAALRVRHLDDRAATEDGSVRAPGWALLDLLLRYRWRNVELSLALLNLTDRRWNESQFAEATCQRSDVGSGPDCPVGGLGTGIDDLTFSAGMPFGVRGGLQFFF